MNTGTPASAAIWAPSSVGRPTVVSPSVSSTIAPGATSSSPLSSDPLAPPPAASSGWSPARSTSRAVPVARASPMAVDSSSSRASMAPSTAGRSRVGRTSTLTVPANDTSPTSTSGSTWPTNELAATFAASRRVGSTSVASIDSDTSNSTRMRPSLSVRSVETEIGRAMATTPAASPASCRTATTWRRQRGRDGATWSSSSTWVNRMVARLRHTSTKTYATPSSATAISHHSRCSARNSIDNKAFIGVPRPRRPSVAARSLALARWHGTNMSIIASAPGRSRPAPACGGRARRSTPTSRGRWRGR